VLEALKFRRGFDVHGVHGHAGERPDERAVVVEINAAEADDTFIEEIASGLLGREYVISAGWDRLNGH
jgi:hypothetical protein